MKLKIQNFTDSNQQWVISASAGGQHSTDFVGSIEIEVVWPFYEQREILKSQINSFQIYSLIIVIFVSISVKRFYKC